MYQHKGLCVSFIPRPWLQPQSPSVAPWAKQTVPTIGHNAVAKKNEVNPYVKIGNTPYNMLADKRQGTQQCAQHASIYLREKMVCVCAQKIARRIHQKLLLSVSRLEVWPAREAYFSLDLLTWLEFFFLSCSCVSFVTGEKHQETNQGDGLQGEPHVPQHESCCHPVSSSGSVVERSFALLANHILKTTFVH